MEKRDRRRAGRIGRAGARRLPVVLGVGLAFLFIHLVSGRMRPIMIDLASAQIQNEVIGLLHQAVEESPLSYDQVVSLEKDGEGHITLLKSDMSAVSAYRSELVARLLDRVDELRARTLRIPLGSLTGVELLSGRGPGVPVRVLSVGVVRSGAENLFTSAGINQTRHQIMLTFTVDTRLVLPGADHHVETTTELCAAETVIVGAVPEHVTYFGRAEAGPD